MNDFADEIEPLIMSVETKDPGKPQEIMIYSYRWIVLALFSFASLSNSMLWITFAPITEQAKEFLGIESNLAIDMFSMIYMILYIPFIFLSNYLISKQGLRFGILTGGFLTCVGSLLRALGGLIPMVYRFPVVIAGQSICALAQTFILQVPPLITNDWFGANERTLATSIGVFMNQFGIGIGFLMSSFMVQTAKNVGTLLFIKAIICSTSFFLSIIGIRSRPSSPPSLSNLKKVATKMSYKDSLKILKDMNFVIFMLTFGVAVGIFYALSTVLGQILIVFNYTTENSGLLGFIMTVTGIFGAFLIGIISDRMKVFKLLLLTVYVGSITTLLWFNLILAENNFIHIAICIAITGFFLTATMPVAFEISAEVTFPINEDISSGLLMLCAQIFGILLILISNLLISYNLHTAVPIMYFWIFLAIGLVSLFIKVRYKRIEADKSAKV